MSLPAVAVPRFIATMLQIKTLKAAAEARAPGDSEDSSLPQSQNFLRDSPKPEEGAARAGEDNSPALAATSSQVDDNVSSEEHTRAGEYANGEMPNPCVCLHGWWQYSGAV